MTKIRQSHKIAIIKKARFYATHHQPIGFWIFLNLVNPLEKEV